MRSVLLLLMLALTAPAVIGSAQPHPELSTFSIVACDTANDFLGVAIQSRVIAAGAIVPAAEAGVGAIATQAFANVAYKADALRMLREGMTPEQVTAEFVRTDPRIQTRQFALVDHGCRVSAFTGDSTFVWSGHRVGANYSVQGNILAGPEVVEAMARAYEESEANGLPFGERLLESLKAGQQAGGDTRGRQGAGLLIVRPGGGYAGGDDRYADLRVEDHAEPILELERVYRIWMSVFHPDDHFLPNGTEGYAAPSGPHVCTLRNRLADLGYGTPTTQDTCAFDEEVIPALRSFQEAEGLPALPALTPEAAARLRERTTDGSGRP